jgi:hypothetical protein
MSTKHPACSILTLTDENTEYCYTSPGRADKIIFKARTSVALRMSDQIGKVAGSTDPYFTIAAGASMSLENLEANQMKLYFSCGTAGTIIEIFTIA